MKKTGVARTPFPGRWSDQVNKTSTGSKGAPESRREGADYSYSCSRNQNQNKSQNRNRKRSSDIIKTLSKEETKRTNKWKVSRKVSLLVLLLAVFMGIGTISETIWHGFSKIDSYESEGDTAGSGEEKTAAVTFNYGEKLRITNHNINFHQSDDWENKGVYALIKVCNDNDEAVDRMLFLVSQREEIVTNFKNDGDYFKASGYVPPHGEGYMCAHMIIGRETRPVQGEIIPVDGYACKLRTDYMPPSGRISGFDKKADGYHADIVNRSGQTFGAGKAFVVAVESGYSELAGSWGAGELNQDVVDGETVHLRNVIVNPGLKRGETAEFQVFLVDM